MTAQVNRQDVQRKNPPVRSMADRLHDFTRMNPPIITGDTTSEDPQEFIDEVPKILVAVGPLILRRLSWLPTSSRMLHRLGARCGKIVVS